jgi:hypothetical protein
MEHKIEQEGFSISLPTTWKVIVFESPTEEAFQSFKSHEPQLADMILRSVNPGGTFFGFDIAPQALARTVPTSVQVLAIAIPSGEQITYDKLVENWVRDAEQQQGIESPVTGEVIPLAGGKRAALLKFNATGTSRFTGERVAFAASQYGIISNNHLFVLLFGTAPEAIGEYAQTFEEVARRFKPGVPKLRQTSEEPGFLPATSSPSYYVTVSELNERKPELTGTNVRLLGEVIKCPISWNAVKSEVSFKVTDKQQTMDVVFPAASEIVDWLRSAQTAFGVLVEGALDETGTFRAKSVTGRSELLDFRPVTISVSLTGAVVCPGRYSLPSDSTVKDAVEVAGGFTQNADASHVNLSFKLADGMKINIPNKGQ